MKEPKYNVGSLVHIHGTSGVASVIFVEYTGRIYRYTVAYPCGKRKQAEETELIKVQ